MTDSLKLIDTMLDFFGPTGTHWTKNHYVAWSSDDSHQQRCMVGAYGLQLPYGDMHLVDATMNHQLLGFAIRDAILQEFGDRVIPESRAHPNICAIAFNDHPDTTFDDVRLVLEKVRTTFEEKSDI